VHCRFPIFSRSPTECVLSSINLIGAQKVESPAGDIDACPHKKLVLSKNTTPKVARGKKILEMMGIGLHVHNPTQINKNKQHEIFAGATANPARRSHRSGEPASVGGAEGRTYTQPYMPLVAVGKKGLTGRISDIQSGRIDGGGVAIRVQCWRRLGQRLPRRQFGTKSLR